MTNLPPVGECDVEKQDGLARYRTLTAKWLISIAAPTRTPRSNWAA